LNYKNVLVVSGHTDDGEYGAAATIARLVDEGATVHYLAFSAPRPELKDECARALKILGIDDVTIMNLPRRRLPEHRQTVLQTLVDFDRRLKPDLVLVPSSRDIHQDHAVIHQEASRGIFRGSTILGYEIPHNIRDWNYTVRVTDDQLDRKIFSLSQYETQIGKYYFRPDFIQSWARFRGGAVGGRYAEAFEVIKILEL